MAKKVDAQNDKQVAHDKPNQEQIYVDKVQFRHVDQVVRWQQEYEKCVAIENHLAEMSTLTYEEVDYAPQVVRAMFKERVISDFSHIIEEGRMAAEGKFVTPIITHLVLVVFFFLMLVFSSQSILLWLSGISLMTTLILLVLLIQRRQNYIEKIVLGKKQEVEKRIAYEKKKIDDERKKHDESEDERIKIIDRLLAGEVSSIFSKIEYSLSKARFSFYLIVDIDLHNNIPCVKVWLPSKSLIPTVLCTLKPSGRPSYEEKDVRMINKQYLELCAALSIKVMSIIYCQIPTFDIGYLYAMSKDVQDTQCVMASKLDRDILKRACSAANGLAGIQKMNATFIYDTSLMLLPVEYTPPEEWGTIDQELIRSLRVNLFANGRE